ncbi:hypothetical protein H9636_01385 [Ureibacillus sp. Re31]|uniref:Uncharacterized protein n=1 Tax=Ureibacillus galli TaxID=2762222 RepID=A0ABR8X7L8_9BACL|nr:hypothetical protein [Ureibacillus galli]MBD8025299.1 hypothetical protein [Ureibacillus galli]
MTEITFLASSKPFKIPEEIEENNNITVFEREEDVLFFSVQEIDNEWKNSVEGLFSLPYIYEAYGVGNHLFLTYLAKYMEVGDVIEIYNVPSQSDFDQYRRDMEERPEPIEVNVERYTYRNVYGLFQLNPKKWLEELSHRNYISHHGVTTFVKY